MFQFAFISLCIYLLLTLLQQLSVSVNHRSVCVFSMPQLSLFCVFPKLLLLLALTQVHPFLVLSLWKISRCFPFCTFGFGLSLPTGSSSPIFEPYGKGVCCRTSSYVFSCPSQIGTKCTLLQTFTW